MEPLERKIAAQLEALPVAVALVLPGGRRLGAVQAAVTLTLSDWSSMAVLAAGQIGRLAEDIVEGRVEVQGPMRALMAAAAQLLPGSPVGSDTGWWTQIAAPRQVAGRAFLAAEGCREDPVPLRRLG